MSDPNNWTTVSESRFTWEREALDFVRQRFPAHEPYRAWSNFEFIGEDGSINEVDLLVFTPLGFFLIEIKSRPGRLFGDEGAWTWETDGRLYTQDNPLFAANAKAKRLRTLLERQKAFYHKERPPFVEALVFCSDPDLQCDLTDIARYRVCLRDREPAGNSPAGKGILAAIRGRECPGLDPVPRGTHDRVMARQISQALEQAGVRPTQSHRRVSDFMLGELLEEGAGYQDREASHVQLPAVKRRVRLYLVRATALREDRETILRAAQREFQLLEKLQHPNILRTYAFTEHELGPAIIFGHDPQAVRLDHYLAQKGEALGVETALDLLRQIAETVRFAHDKKVVHRALSPQSILIVEASDKRPRVLLYNWQAGYAGTGSAGGGSGQIHPTNHLDRLVDDATTAYMAPEALADEANTGEHLDVFSLGAIAYHLFSGRPPAANGLELSDKLRQTRGLSISSVMNGAGEFLQTLIQYSTHPDTANRMDSATEFLRYLDEVENELTTPDREIAFDPSRAQKGDLLPGGFTVLKRLGQGASAVALLVERQNQEYVLKAANDPEHNARINEEAGIIQKLRHPYIVEHCETVQVGDRAAFLMRPVLVDRDKENRRVETLGQRLRQEGRLHIDLLQRFGEDLLEAVKHLEEQGIPHRDIKPDNIVLGRVGRGDKLHLVLFDFSLSRTRPDNIRAGTIGYLDPLLPLRNPPRWDLQAERYAAAVTLYEMATGALPVWGEGAADPSHLECEITLDPELLDSGLRDSLTEFFRRVFRREVTRRFDNAEEMLRAWRRCFEGIELPGALSEESGEEELRGLLAGATLETELAALRLGARAANALDRANLLTVRDLLTTSVRQLMRLRGVGNKTRREILAAVKILRETLAASLPETPPSSHSSQSGSEEASPLPETANLSVDLLHQELTRSSAREGETARQALNLFLGLEGNNHEIWPGQAEVARQLGVTRARIGQVAVSLGNRWVREPALTPLRAELEALLKRAGGVMTPPEIAEALLLTRGSVQDEPERTKRAMAVARAAVEAERLRDTPRFQIRRDAGRLFIACDPAMAEFAARLGDCADRLAAEDPLLPPERALERLRQLPLPSGAEPLPDARLTRLAVAASHNAALSGRQEFYPRGMDPLRALKLSQGALYGATCLSVGQIHERVNSRYPHAAPLPRRPDLDALLQEAGFDFLWDPERRPQGVEEKGCYVSRQPDRFSLSTGSESRTHGLPPAERTDTEDADARHFEDRLRRSLREGSFLALVVSPARYEAAWRHLEARFPIEVVDLETLFIEALHRTADSVKARWELVLKADAAPGQGDWNRLMLLVERALPDLEQRLVSNARPLLLIHGGLLARYNRMDLLERLRDRAGRRDGPAGVWILAPGHEEARIDDRAVPLLGPGQRARIPESWLSDPRYSATMLTEEVAV